MKKYNGRPMPKGAVLSSEEKMLSLSEISDILMRYGGEGDYGIFRIRPKVDRYFPIITDESECSNTFTTF